MGNKTYETVAPLDMEQECKRWGIWDSGWLTRKFSPTDDREYVCVCATELLASFAAQKWGLGESRQITLSEAFSAARDYGAAGVCLVYATGDLRVMPL